MDDPDLMRDILETLIDDTGRQLIALDHALAAANAPETARLAHYSKGACANVGANSSARLLQEIERQAKTGDLSPCGESLVNLRVEFEKLRKVAAVLAA